MGQIARKLLLRKAELADCQAVLTLWLRLLDEHVDMDPRFSLAPDVEERWRNDFPEWIKSDFSQIWLVENDAVVAAFISVHTWTPPPIHPDFLELYIREIYVLPSYRGRGFGRALVQQARDWGKSIGISQIRATVLTQNTESGKFWERMGASPYFSQEMNT